MFRQRASVVDIIHVFTLIYRSLVFGKTVDYEEQAA